MKNSLIFSIAVSVILIGVGIFFPLPDKKIDLSYSYNAKWTGDGIEYVGGDAYNYQMEASLKAGWVSGVMALKAIFISAGAIILTTGVNSYVQTAEKST